MFRPHFRFSRFWVASLSIVILLLAALWGSEPVRGAFAHKASAALLLHCEGTESISYSPGIANTPQTVVGSAHDTLAPCVVPGDLTQTGGTAAFSVTIPHATCTSITFPHYSIALRWNNGTRSVVDFPTTVTTKLVSGETQVVSMGTVMSGVGTGATAVRTLTSLNLNLTACFTEDGSVSNGGPFQLSFT